MDGQVARDEPRRARPRPLALRRARRRGAQPGVAGEAEVVVRAEVHERAAAHRDDRPLRRGERLEGAPQPLRRERARARRRSSRGRPSPWPPQRTTRSARRRPGSVARQFQSASCGAWPVEGPGPAGVGRARSTSPCASTIPTIASGASAGAREVVAHHGAVRAGVEDEVLALAEVHLASAHHEDVGGRHHEPEDGDGGEALLGGDGLHVRHGRARPRVQEVHGHAVDAEVADGLGELDALLRRLAHAEDAARAELQPLPLRGADRSRAAPRSVCVVQTLSKKLCAVSRLWW